LSEEYRDLFKGLNREDGAQLERSLEFVFQHLSEIQRKSGENYAEHGIQTAMTLSEVTSDISLLKAAVLHDFFLHNDSERLVRESPLNSDEIELARKMHQLRGLVIDSRTKDLDKVLSSFIQDERLFPMRMAHRLNDVRQLKNFQPRLRRKIAKETLHMYTALASRLGMHAWRYEMEDICFKEVHPTIAFELEDKFNKLRSFDEECLFQTKKFLSERFEARGIECRIESRVKGLYSTYRKMILKHREFEELTDRLAIRIVAYDLMDCYRILGVIHTFMHPIPGKLKDYIGAPKENSYQSIHTVVYPLAGITEQPIDIQIRTEFMNELCENGPAAHADYKRFYYAINDGVGKVSLFRNLAHLRQRVNSPKQFEKVLRKYFSGDQISVFDPDDNLYHLKKPATALDFVVHAFPSKYKKTREIRINGRKSNLHIPLKDGDIVSVRFGRKLTINKDWINYSSHDAIRLKLSS
jgi:guanosine-3',5'-bis(diphosphate) 3'-pyrophosphohydrolase